ncbi:MAG: hypothetical protein QOH90_924 [Actinomycetota bacterium]|nr:hypothetical protein [Actinomycetota bacterium]
MQRMTSTLQLAQESVSTEAETPAPTCDLNVACPVCDIQMEQEHAHMRCPTCGYRDSCCF